MENKKEIIEKNVDDFLSYLLESKVLNEIINDPEIKLKLTTDIQLTEHFLPKNLIQTTYNVNNKIISILKTLIEKLLQEKIPLKNMSFYVEKEMKYSKWLELLNELSKKQYK